MRILILGDSSNPHIIKWANALYTAGLEIIIFSIRKPDLSNFSNGIDIRSSESLSNITYLTNAALPKLKYLKVIPQIKALIKEKKPDIVHAHYASSYGFLGALLNFHPYVISVWGGDVIDFPVTSIFHRVIFKFNLIMADRILTTSHFMANLLLKYTKKSVDVTPFGIDLSVFKSGEKIRLLNENFDAVIGCIKGLEWYYGIEYLIEAFEIVLKSLPLKKLKLIIVGGGAIEQKIRAMIKEKNLEDKILLTGKVDYKEVQKYHNLLDIFVAVSVYQESFGVAVLEASACSKPVIVSRVGGMVEVVGDNLTGYIVPPRDTTELGEKIIKLVLNPELRIQMGKAGREKVEKEFDLALSLTKMINIYNDMVKKI